MKARIKNYLSITKKEWNGMVVLVVLIALVLAAPYVYQLLHKDNTINFKDFDKAIVQLSKIEQVKGYADDKPVSDDKLLHPVMFPFNPNSLSVAQWKQLGLSERQANVIIHYEAKGGKFYRKEDVKKIYAITADDYTRLEPYINIPELEYTSKKAKPGEIIELNAADSARMTMIRGVGPSFAVRIIRYRNRLGGFYNKEQLKEIYGVDSIMYAGIKDEVSVNPAKVKKIDINKISFDQLRIFPYLGYKQVNAIMQYRTQHGNYNSIADMKNIAILDDGILRKIEPYLSFQ
ncbi:ComEA family DNA-binding protein [Mucilaginibacter sp. X4EP1]|uniref:ComEA family DNA-binding protein n=1 Tax=Mucilaginibacter sp. X4EP1 TaxID=2723092 RepID=UPI0021681F11|nr:helix-hairpin-helix domain-containing protein [Mucilaginibacter sp. X4EP1]MCS3812928.1 DNA uptake protein ComE-like DNA-binding protein [Mucilaginibacter sp. X4EP1]